MRRLRTCEFRVSIFCRPAETYRMGCKPCWNLFKRAECLMMSCAESGYHALLQSNVSCVGQLCGSSRTTTLRVRMDSPMATASCVKLQPCKKAAVIAAFHVSGIVSGASQWDGPDPKPHRQMAVVPQHHFLNLRLREVPRRFGTLARLPNQSFKEELRDSELLLAELQEKADSLEEKHTLLLRRVRRAERDRDVAVQRSAEVEVAVRQLREEAAPVIARFMESEVLRSQLQACSEDLVRLKEEMAACKEELAEGLPKLAELEDDEVWVVARQSGPGVGSGEGGDRGAVEVVGVARVVTAWGGGVDNAESVKLCGRRGNMRARRGYWRDGAVLRAVSLLTTLHKQDLSPSFAAPEHGEIREAQGSSPEVRTPTETRRRTAFVSLATEDYGRGALVMSASMRTRLPEDVDVVVFSDAELAVVPGVSVRELEDLPKVSPPQQAGEPLMPHFRFCWRKLGLWALEEYDVIFYLDSDMLAVGDVAGLLDFLPEEGQLGAVPSCECWRSESCTYTLGPREGLYVNAGLLCFRPSMLELGKMREALANWTFSERDAQPNAAHFFPEAMPFAEQDFLNSFFRGRIRPLPSAFNALQHAMKNPKHMAALELEKCRILHYVMGKPWERASRVDEDVADLRALWWQAWKDNASKACLHPRWERHRVHAALPLFLVKDFVNVEGEASLISEIYGEELKGRWTQLRRRRLMCLGGVPHPDGAICEDLPQAIFQLGSNLVRVGATEGPPNQCFINHYSPGEGIDAHCDGPQFHPEVAILTLEGPALLHFGLVEKKAYPHLPPRFEVLLEPRSLLVMRGEAYNLYVHRIDHAEAETTRDGLEVQRARRRTSLTFRRLAHVKLESKDVKGEAERLGRQAQWRWFEVEELRCQHALKVAELERARREQVDELKRSNAEAAVRPEGAGSATRAWQESDQLRSALESARWQADVYVREHQEAVREICLRQRENARLAKKHSESRQEALELAVRLEALKAAEVRTTGLTQYLFSSIFEQPQKSQLPCFAMAVEEADPTDKHTGTLDNNVAMQTDGVSGSKKPNSQGYPHTTATQNCKTALVEVTKVTKEASTTSRPDPEDEATTANYAGPLDVSMSDAVTEDTAPEAETETPQEDKNLPAQLVEPNRQEAKTCRGQPESQLTACFNLPDVTETLGAACCDPPLLARLGMADVTLHRLIFSRSFAERRAQDFCENGMIWASGCTSLEQLQIGLSVSEVCAADSQNHLYFEYGGGVNLLEETKQLVHAAALFAQKHPRLRLHVDAHAGVGAPRGIATSTSRRRAECVQTELVALGVDQERVSTTSWGRRVASVWSEPEGNAAARAELYFRLGEKEFPVRPDHYQDVPEGNKGDSPDSDSDGDHPNIRRQRMLAMLRALGYPVQIVYRNPENVPLLARQESSSEQETEETES
ncbi:Alkbh6 [Symbiodinium sp. KB8]|nr:Alkbh6 [Symbiodinium sp. KB8]